MDRDCLERSWERYNQAWSNLEAADRRSLLSEAVDDDVTVTSPDFAGVGTAALTTAIEQFQRKFPGAYFHTERLILQHDQSLAEWSMRNQAGNLLMPGRTYARYNAGGRVEWIAGFWITPPE